MRTKVLYLIRHCQAGGQDPAAPLTAEGRAQAEVLADFLGGFPIDRIVSSPYSRAVETAAPLAGRLGLDILTDDRLRERVLSGGNSPNWEERLRQTFLDLDLSFPGGESSRAAMRRAVAVVEEALPLTAQGVVLVSHGCLLTLLLKHFDDRFGFAEWAAMTNPDVFRVILAPEGARVERIWNMPPP